MSEVRAQEAPSIRDLSVIPSGEGVSARCEFEGYMAGSGYSMELYLCQVMEDETVREIALRSILPPADGSGVEITGEEPVEPGIYQATLVMDRMDGGMLPVDNFSNSILYDVIRDGNGYVVTPRQEETEEPEPDDEPDNEPNGEPDNEPDGEPEAVPERPSGEAPEIRDESGFGEKAEEKEYSCSHSAVYRIAERANPDRDAVLAGECVKCGEVLSYAFVPNSAYAAFLEASARAIQNAQTDEIMIETQRWVSFNRTVFEAMAMRPELSVTVRYRYNGRRYEVTIPAGAEVNDLTDENGFCGFRYLDQAFGGREITD